MRRIFRPASSGLYSPDYASGMRRLLAILVDVSAPFVLWIMLLLRSQDTTGNGGSDLMFGLLFAFLVTAPFLTVLESTTGRTPGKFLLNIRVVDQHGDNPTLRCAAIRNFVRVYDFAITMCFLYWFVFWDIFIRKPLPGWLSGAYRHVWYEDGQRWGDQLAGTYVIRGPWKPVLTHGSRPASSEGDSAFGPARYPADGSSGIRLSGRKPKK